MTTNVTTDPAAWRAARLAHLEAEKAFTRQRDALSAARRELPWLEIETDYRFDAPAGEVSLLDLFGLRGPRPSGGEREARPSGGEREARPSGGERETLCGQLIVYHFMMGPDWEEGCPSCSFWADNYDGTLEHLRARDTALVAVSRAPLDRIEAYRKRMEWSFPWVSSANSSFNFDFAVSFTPEQLETGEPNYNFGTQHFGGDEAPGISVFRRDGDDVYLTYQTFSRGLDMVNGTYHLLDLTSKGRDEAELPWSMAWLRRHDSY